MQRVTRSAIIDAPIERVWEVLRDFNSHDRWHPAIEASHIEGGERSDQVGCVRNFTLKDGKRSHLFEKTKFKGLVNKLAFHPKGDWLLGTGGAGDGFFVFMDLAKNKVVKEEKVKFHVHGIALNEDATTLYAAGHNTLGLYEMKS